MDLVDLLASTGLLTAILAQLIRTNRQLGELRARIDDIESEVRAIRSGDVLERAARDAARRAAKAVSWQVRALEQRLVALEAGR